MTMLQAAPDLPAPADELHKRVRQARGYRMLSQDHLLDLMRELDAQNTPTRRTYSKWENGHMSPTVYDLVLIARATGFPVAWFVVGLEGPSSDPDRGPTLGGRHVACDADVVDLAARRSRSSAPSLDPVPEPKAA